jgi:hypothetical protein
MKLKMNDAEQHSGCKKDQNGCQNSHDDQQRGNDLLKEHRLNWYMRSIGCAGLVWHGDPQGYVFLYQTYFHRLSGQVKVSLYRFLLVFG